MPMQAVFEKVLPLITALACLLPHSVSAQINPLQDKLESVTRLECEFATLGSAQWDGGQAALEISDSDLSIVFFDIDTEEGTAEAEGEFGGVSYIVVRYTEGYLHLMQMFRAGPLFVTSVLAQETTEGRMMAMHSRTEFSEIALPGFTSRPETYVGDCSAS